MLPFMASAPPTQVGGWRFVKWEDAVRDRVPAGLRSRYLRWCDKYRWDRLAGGSPHAALRETETALPLDEMVVIMMYCHLSRGNDKLGCTRDSFNCKEVRVRQPRYQSFRRIKPYRTKPFYASAWSEHLLLGLSALFAQAPSLGQSELLPRIRRAIILHNEAYWLWDDRPISNVFFVLTLALAFEALFTKARQRKSDAAPGISATVRQGLSELLLHDRFERYHERGLKKWWDAFYGLRSRIAHGGKVNEDDFLTFGDKKAGRHHAEVARKMLSAVIFSLLVKKGLSTTDGAMLECEQLVKAALGKMVPNSVRFKTISDMVECGDFVQRSHQRVLDDLLRGIQDWDAAFSIGQARRLTTALGRLTNYQGRLGRVLFDVVREAQTKVIRLQFYEQQMRSHPPAGLL